MNTFSKADFLPSRLLLSPDIEIFFAAKKVCDELHIHVALDIENEMKAFWDFKESFLDSVPTQDFEDPSP